MEGPVNHQYVLKEKAIVSYCDSYVWKGTEPSWECGRPLIIDTSVYERFVGFFDFVGGLVPHRYVLLE